MAISNVPASTNKYETKPSHVNFSTVAVLAVTEDVPLSAFTYELIHSLSSIGNLTDSFSLIIALLVNC